MSATQKLYKLNKYIDLPEKLTTPSSMFPMKPMYTLDSDLSKVYYGDDHSDVAKMESGNASLADVEARQTRILAKLKEFKNSLDMLAQTNTSLKCNNVSRIENSKVMNPEKRKLELISIIGKVQSQLVTIDQKDYSNLEEQSVVSVKQEVVLDQLQALQKEISIISDQTITLEPAKYASIDLQSQQSGIISIIEGLQRLLVDDISQYQKAIQGGDENDVVKYHTEIIKLIHKLQNQLDNIKKSITSQTVEVNAVGQDLVISCPPSRPLYSIILLKKALVEHGVKVYSTCATHSSVKVSVPECRQFNEDEGKPRLGHDLFLSVHWKDQRDVSFMISPLKQWPITGEGNVIRYISRLFPAGSSFNYESGDLLATTSTDLLLDDIQGKLVDGDGKERSSFIKKLNARLGQSSYLGGTQMGISDIFASSVLLQLNLDSSVPNNVSSWLGRVLQWGAITKGST